ncbi:MAG: bifunctional DNA-formamidopyrimidine glycosylase/DNA-(apurinic or apyrimidinic site) lyase [Candidatus Magasanikbacteria bacterium]|nr:bifunctional DNA-formamidopyrimidine glycosylase/DNA-(apurinic or apyrimidinic site) lyase [Candidatus Magasanikbacteria bacterium]
MPELPEVETIRRDLKKLILNKKIKTFLVTQKARIRNSSLGKFRNTIKNNYFKNIDRIGKLLIFVMPEDKYLLIHLKMTGQLIYEKDHRIVAGGHPEPESEKSIKNKFTRVEFIFSDGSKLYFNDMRRFGYLQIVDKKELKKIKEGFGMEPLTKSFRFENFLEILKNRKTNIKALLLNQKAISGIGNIYADEVCFDAGIRPGRKINQLSKLEKKELFKSLEKIIKIAIEKRGTSFKNYLDGSGRQGNFVKHLKVYGRSGKKCKKCKTELKKIKLAGRGTTYCPKCQK